MKSEPLELCTDYEGHVAMLMALYDSCNETGKQEIKEQLIKLGAFIDAQLVSEKEAQK